MRFHTRSQPMGRRCRACIQIRMLASRQACNRPGRPRALAKATATTVSDATVSADTAAASFAVAIAVANAMHTRLHVLPRPPLQPRPQLQSGPQSRQLALQLPRPLTRLQWQPLMHPQSRASVATAATTAIANELAAAAATLAKPEQNTFRVVRHGLTRRVSAEPCHIALLWPGSVHGRCPGHAQTAPARAAQPDIAHGPASLPTAREGVQRGMLPGTCTCQ